MRWGVALIRRCVYQGLLSASLPEGIFQLRNVDHPGNRLGVAFCAGVWVWVFNCQLPAQVAKNAHLIDGRDPRRAFFMGPNTARLKRGTRAVVDGVGTNISLRPPFQEPSRGGCVDTPTLIR